jgi:hypothetical protein
VESKEERWHISQLGSVRIVAEEDDVLAEARVRGVVSQPSVTRYGWDPPADLRHQVPEGFAFALRCIRFPGDGRWFYPIGSFDGFIAEAFVGGLALIDMIKGLGSEGRHAYRAMWQFFQRVRRTRERFSNDLLNATSLRVSHSGRGTSQEYSILPESVGLNAQGQGKPWSVSELLREGMAEAKVSGVSKPTEADCVHYGLVRAARLNPLDIPERDVRPLIRQALFESILLNDESAKAGNGSSEAVAREAVIERSLGAVQRHLGDRQAEYDNWFAGPKSSFIHQIAQQKRASGGPLARELVRRILLDLGWQAYDYVGDCLHAMMRVFQRLVPEPLTELEGQRFARMHLKQPCFGQLPLVLFHERFPFLRSILTTACEDPADREAVTILYRLLHYYGEMATKRRATDRLMKARKDARGHGYQGECSLNAEFDPQDSKGEGAEAASETGEDPPGSEGAETHQETAHGTSEVTAADRFQEIAERVREEKGIRCGCHEPNWDARVVEMNDETAIISHDCGVCSCSATTTVSMTDLRKITMDLLAD